MKKPDPADGRVAAALSAIVTLATRRPRLALIATLLAVVAGGLITVLGPLDVSTSRRGLVSEDFPNKAREQRFFERFGRPDVLVLVLQGGTTETRHRVVDRLERRLGEIPQLRGRILGRLGIEQVAELIMLHDPALLGDLARAAERQGPGILEGNLVAWLTDLDDRVRRGLSGEPPPADGADGTEGPRSLALALEALDAELRGTRSPLPADLVPGAGPGPGRSVDEAGYLASADGRQHFVLMFPELSSDEGAYLTPFVTRVRAVRDRALREAGDPDVTCDLTGEPALAADELRILNIGLYQTSALSALGILLILYLAFRSMRHTVIALVPLAAGVVITLGITELLYDGLNLVTSAFMSVLMGLGIDFGVHTLHRHGEEQRSGRPDPAAMRSALLRAGPGVTTGAVTTMLAFLTMTITDFTAYAELGVITVIGVAVMLICTFLLIPPLMRIGGGRRATPAPEIPGMSALVALVARAPRAILLIAFLATVAAAISFAPRGPGYDGRYFDFLPEDTESRRALDQIERTRGMGLAFANLEAKSFDEARRLGDRLRAAPVVSTVQTVTDLLPVLDAARLESLRRGVASLDSGAIASPRTAPAASSPEALLEVLGRLEKTFATVTAALDFGGRDTSAVTQVVSAIRELRRTVVHPSVAGTDALASLERRLAGVLGRAVRTARAVAARGRYSPDDVPPVFRHRFVSRDGARLAVYAYPSGDIWDSEVAGRFAEQVQAIQPEASGLAVDIRPYELLIIDGFKRASWLAAVFVTLVLLCIFRSITDTALAMLPVLLGWCWMLGLMKPLGLTFTAANIVALPLILGIGLDAGAHMVHRHRETLLRGRSKARLTDLVGGTGAAVMVASLTTMIAFGALMTADYRAMRGFGLLLTVGIGLCLVASVLVLPALLVVLKRVRFDPERRDPQ